MDLSLDSYFCRIEYLYPIFVSELSFPGRNFGFQFSRVSFPCFSFFSWMSNPIPQCNEYLSSICIPHFDIATSSLLSFLLLSSC